MFDSYITIDEPGSETVAIKKYYESKITDLTRKYHNRNAALLLENTRYLSENKLLRKKNDELLKENELLKIEIKANNDIITTYAKKMAKEEYVREDDSNDIVLTQTDESKTPCIFCENNREELIKWQTMLNEKNIDEEHLRQQIKTLETGLVDKDMDNQRFLLQIKELETSLAEKDIETQRLHLQIKELETKFAEKDFDECVFRLQYKDAEKKLKAYDMDSHKYSQIISGLQTTIEDLKKNDKLLVAKNESLMSEVTSLQFGFSELQEQYDEVKRQHEKLKNSNASKINLLVDDCKSLEDNIHYAIRERIMYEYIISEINVFIKNGFPYECYGNMLVYFAERSKKQVSQQTLGETDACRHKAFAYLYECKRKHKMIVSRQSATKLMRVLISNNDIESIKLLLDDCLFDFNRSDVNMYLKTRPADAITSLLSKYL